MKADPAATEELLELQRLMRTEKVSASMFRLLGRKRPERPRLFDRATETRVIEAATSRHADLGLPFTTWSLVKLERYLRGKEDVLSRGTIRRILHRPGLRFLTGQTWCRSDDLEYEVKKTAIIP